MSRQNHRTSNSGDSRIGIVSNVQDKIEGRGTRDLEEARLHRLATARRICRVCRYDADRAPGLAFRRAVYAVVRSTTMLSLPTSRAATTLLRLASHSSSHSASALANAHVGAEAASSPKRRVSSQMAGSPRRARRHCPKVLDANLVPCRSRPCPLCEEVEP